MVGLWILLLAGFGASGQMGNTDRLDTRLVEATRRFLSSLDEIQRKETQLLYEDPARFDWNFTPRNRKGVTFKTMNAAQKQAAMEMLRVVLSADGYLKAEQIMDLENVLRVVENRPKDDTYRDPDNYAFLVFGEPGSPVWGWRFEGHHLSLHFSSIGGKIAFLPGFMGSNPAKVLADVPQKDRQVLRPETDLAFQLLDSFSSEQTEAVMLGMKAPHEIFTGNARTASLEKREGLAMGAMTADQRELFKKLIGIYLDRYHITLKNQQWAQLEAQGLDNIHFAWMGDTTPGFASGLGHYYRIHGPGILIEFDNTQNNGNHIHSVVRDLQNDFGDDLLRLHYETNRH